MVPQFWRRPFARTQISCGRRPSVPLIGAVQPRAGRAREPRGGFLASPSVATNDASGTRSALRWWSKNFKDQDKATSDLRLGNYTPFQTKLAILVGMADAVSCDSTRLGNGYTSSEAPRYADENSSALRPFLIWQLCSGFAHGRPWASLGMNAMASRPSDDEGVKLVRLTSDPRRILSVTFPAMRLLEDLLRVYQERSQAS